MNIILASQSPRRRELIKLLNLPYSCTSVDADEESIQDEDLIANVSSRAFLKGRTLQKRLGSHSGLILAADTAVALNNQMLNKPADSAHAKNMLHALRGQTHKVHSGVVLLNAGLSINVAFVNTAVVHMRNYSEQEIDAYIKTGDPMDKAGAYAIQHPTFQPVKKLSGCYLSVMGLPLCQIIMELETLGSVVNFNRTQLIHAHQNHQCAELAKLTSA